MAAKNWVDFGRECSVEKRLTKTRPAARQAQTNWRASVPRFTPENLLDRTFRVVDLLGLVRADYEIRRLRSAQSAFTSMGHVAAALGHIKASDLTTDHLTEYMLARRAEGASEATIRIELSLLSRGYRLGVKQRRIHGSIKPEFPQIDRRGLVVRQGFLTEPEVREVCRHLHPDIADLVAFLFASAWRRGEATALEWAWVSGTEIHLPTSKNGQPRILPLAGEVADIIARRRERELGPWVFHRRGAKIGHFDYQWRTATKKSGLSGKLVHDLRRSAIKRMMEHGANQRDAMAISGHLTASTFHRYQIVDTARQVEILDRLARRPPSRMSGEAPQRVRLRDWA